MDSNQPRFREAQSIYNSVYRWVMAAYEQAPPYGADTRLRDKWLAEFWKQEPFLAGVITSVVSIDQNRGWSLVGGRNQVSRFKRVLYEAEGGAGWRHYINLQAQSYYTTDIGAISELGRYDTGVLGALWHVDPTKCVLTGDPEYPLKYKPLSSRGKVQKWSADDFFRCVSMPSILEEMRGVGLCAVSRALKIAQVMCAIYDHDKETLGSKMEKGLLLLSGIGQMQWEEALELRRQSQLNNPQGALNDVITLANDESSVDAKLVALSNLPRDFDLRTWVDLLMQAYALIFGYDVGEFWMINRAGLGDGGGRDAIQDEKASAKGERNFMLAYQAALQNELPETLLFEIDERNDRGDRIVVETQKLLSETVKLLYDTGDGTPDTRVISRDEARALLTDNGIMPREWIEEGVDADTDETANDKYQVRDNASIRRAASLFPNDPIVRYSFPDNKMRIIWNTGREMLRRRYYPVARAADDEEKVYSKSGIVITVGDIEQAVNEAGEIDPLYQELLLATADEA